MNTIHPISMLNTLEKKAVFDFKGNVIKGSLSSRTATKLVREWVDIHVSDLEEDWILARKNKEIHKIEPLR